MSDIFYKKLVKHWEGVTELPPQKLGAFTPVYKEVTKRLKVMPWPLLLGTSIAIVAALYFFLGSAITFLVTILQRGF